ncbi:hypothetical protein [Brazilian marseillevirus]|uniref:hypothetical protein n=1 Tax=Brazilian marseillevirus TaxID=1813599 RepID=UPI0007851125|nr:hypothetical protein A3303_gp096 [Brazilian marseillevirus]AMQ10604.1 hypothetical protein [Brazilian marseillevirus]
MELVKFLRYEDGLSLTFGNIPKMQKQMEATRKEIVWETYKKYVCEDFEKHRVEHERVKRIGYIFLDENGQNVSPLKLKFPDHFSRSNLDPWIEMSGVLLMDSQVFSEVIEKLEQFSYLRCGTISPHTSFPLPVIEGEKIKFLSALRLNHTRVSRSLYMAGTTHTVS